MKRDPRRVSVVTPFVAKLVGAKPVGATLLAAIVGTVVGAAGCVTAYNRYAWSALDDAPAVEPRPEGCHVDVFEDGQEVTRPHADLGRVVLEWPKAKLDEQGPEGAITTLKAAACEHGAFIIKDLRALPRGPSEGLVYDATFATLLGEDGRPINPKLEKAGAAASPGAEPAAPAASGG